MNQNLDTLREHLKTLGTALRAHIDEVTMLHTFYGRIDETELLLTLRTAIPVQKALSDAVRCVNAFEGELFPEEFV